MNRLIVIACRPTTGASHPGPWVLVYDPQTGIAVLKLVHG